ncbi:unnamed protein product [Caenorhabditis brenneri]
MVLFKGNFTTAGKCSQQLSIGNNFTRCVIVCEIIETCQLCYSLHDVCYHCGRLISLERVQEGIPVGVKIPQNYSYADKICRTFGAIDILNNSVSKSDNSIITNTPPATTSSKKCGGLRIVQRSNVTWCIVVMMQENKTEMNVTTAQKLCNKGGLRISKLDSMEETTILKEIVQNNYKQIYKFSDNSKGVGIWVDGSLRPECASANLTDMSTCMGMKAYNFTDPYIINPTGYDWYTGQPDQNNGTGGCIQMTVFKNESDLRNGKVFNARCDAVADDMVRRVAVLCGRVAK